jgi:hypothetical protein
MTTRTTMAVRAVRSSIATAASRANGSRRTRKAASRFGLEKVPVARISTPSPPASQATSVSSPVRQKPVGVLLVTWEKAVVLAAATPASASNPSARHDPGAVRHTPTTR